MAERNSAAFFYNLHESQQIEQAFATFLSKKGWTTSTTQDNGGFKAYDVIATSGDTSVSYEIKFDKLAPITSRIAVEHFNVMDGTPKPSGITATKADWYVYTFPNDVNYYLISVQKLKRLISEKRYECERLGGNGGWFNLKLFDRNFFVSQCHVVPSFKG